MKKTFLSLMLAGFVLFGANAQGNSGNLLANKFITGVGGSLSWTGESRDVTFNLNDLDYLVECGPDGVPVNDTRHRNVELYPEIKTPDTDPNYRVAQSFYVDMGNVYEVSIVKTMWEGAYATQYNIWITDQLPTEAIFDTEATYNCTTGSTSQTIVLDTPVSGQYIVLQPLQAFNWDWGIKMYSIAAYPPQDAVLTKFNMTPSMVGFGVPTEVNFTFIDQIGQEIPAEEVEVKATGDGEFSYADGILTIETGTYVTFTATMNGVSLTQTVTPAIAPSVPNAAQIKTPIYTNGVTNFNSTAGWVVDYNGAAVNLGEVKFGDDVVAWAFADTRCVFFFNSATTGAWNGNINAAANGYQSLCLDVFASKDAMGYIDFEGVEPASAGVNVQNYFYLTGGEWNKVEVLVKDATKLNNMSIRFDESNKIDILLANIYFTPFYVMGDEQAPEFTGTISYDAQYTSVILNYSATDDKSDMIYYTITAGDNAYTNEGKSGAMMTQTIFGLEVATTYEISIVASDGRNSSAPQTVTVTTLSLPDSPEPDVNEANVVTVYSSWFETDVPKFDAWGSKGTMSVMETTGEKSVLIFANFTEQWGGLVELDTNIGDATHVHFDVITDCEGAQFDFAPVWADAKGENTPGTTVEITAGEWQSFDYDLTEFGYPDYGTDVIQIALTASNFEWFALDNVYFYNENNKGNDDDDDENGIDDINADINNAPVEIFSLQGIRVDNPSSGIYIVRQGNKIYKTVIK